MLQLILGRSGAGKTTYLHELLCQKVRDGNKDIILLVPEQDSFAHERAMLALLGEGRAGAVEVLSFTRLGDALFREFGGQGGRTLHDSQRALCMALALEAARDRLERFAGADGRMVPALLRLRRELGMSGVLPEEFYAASLVLGQGKLTELAEILQIYDALLDERFGGAGDAMQSLRDQLETPRGRDWFAGKIVAVDAFWGFTQQELKVLGAIMERAETVYVTLTLEQLRDQESTIGVFEHTQRTAAQLRGLAQQASVPVAAPVLLQDMPRFYENPALAELERALAGAPYDSRAIPCELYACVDIEVECACAARNIKRLLREDGLRCREIAVLARDTEMYARPLYAALRRAGVPIFEDRRQPVAGQPLLRLLSAALEIAAEGFTLDAVMRWLKTDLTGMAEEDVAALESYALLWRVQGSAWLRDWTAHPGGLGQLPDEASDQALVTLNELRRRAIEPLQNLREELRDCTGVSGAAAIDELLQVCLIPEALRLQKAALEACGCPAEALELGRVWELCMSMLDQIAEIVGDQYAGAARLAALFALSLSYQTLGELPQCLDAVTFGAADRARLPSPKAVFILGFNDGVFPRVPGGAGLLNDRDRAALEGKFNMLLGDPAEKQLALERLIVYRSLTAAREKLYVSWALRTAAGDDLRPCAWAHWLRENFPAMRACEYQLLPPQERLEGESEGFALLCETYAENSELHAALHEYFQANEAYAPRLEALGRAVSARPDELCISPEAAGALFHKKEISPSRVEGYARCAFQYYCQYGLKARAQRTADFDPLLRGSALHAALEQVLRSHGVDALLAMSPPQRRARMDMCMGEYAARHFPAGALPARVTYLYRRLHDIAAQVLERTLAQFGASVFRPVAYELQISPDSQIRLYEVALANGDILRLGGRADRVDCAVINGKQYFRVVDYKTGAKDFSLGDVFDGLGLQMLVYMFALWESGDPALAGLPAGVLYEQARDPVLSSPARDISPEEIERLKQEKSRAAGFVLDDADVLLAMETGGLGLYLPAKMGKHGPEEQVLSLARLGKLRQAADDVLADIAGRMRGGEIPAVPLRGAKFTPCGNCDFHAVCGHEPGMPERMENGMKFEDAVKVLDERFK
ncbi:MAG: PD-(D/E)XK nuclease family protein [Oscillospiraceae bacterium]|nr:PD-(D/E)XK nuclease family protein [Oscillospiraceae bacterium]